MTLVESEFLQAVLARSLQIPTDSMDWSSVMLRGAGPQAWARGLHALWNAPELLPDYWQDCVRSELNGRDIRSEQTRFYPLDLATDLENEALRCLNRVRECQETSRSIASCEVVEIESNPQYIDLIFLCVPNQVDS